MFGRRKIVAPNGRQITDKKMIVIAAGLDRNGGSIKEISAKMNRTTANTRLHVIQCRSMYGFDFRIDGDRFWIFPPR